jgi:hypothetical protein
MPLRMPQELRFARPGSGPELDPRAVDDLLALARQVQHPQGYKFVLETFKVHFARATGQDYTPSTSADWAETDLSSYARRAAQHAPAFLAAFHAACEQLEESDCCVPDASRINDVLAAHGCPLHIEDSSLICSTPLVASPPPPLRPGDAVDRALADAEALVGQSGAASAIDRAHTALHGYLIDLCSKLGVPLPSEPTPAKLFKVLREKHPALQATGPRAADITRILQAFATTIDALAPIRNKASLAHANDLLEEPEAAAALNALRTVFRYVQDSIRRYERGQARRST